MKGTGEVLTLVASVATALGVALAAWQLVLAQRHAQVAFEDGLVKEYREIAYQLPVAAMLGEMLDEQDLVAVLDGFYRYVDLTNEQVFLRKCGRVSRATWRNWCDGIKANLEKPAFKQAWKIIAERAPSSFSELRELESSGFLWDPRS